ncbi:MAG TPA: TonB-dependent receptor [Allosphingosinicella sp.]|nr:TonB-dependent receptor [Allosphingosinicella sp.]
MNPKTRSALLACSAFGALAATGAHAQQAEAPRQSGNQVEEIVVTANKRSENLQDVPIAISAVTNARLEAVGITNTADIASVVPSLNIVTGIGGTQAHLRGIGTTAVGPAIENSVATYVDNVYIFSVSGALVQLNNIAQIEVIKGPQGTLFGRNSTGGVINIRTRDPSHEPTGKLSIGYGNYDTFIGKAYLSAGITEKLAVDIAGFMSLQGDGWGKNLFNGHDVEKQDQYALRSKWLFEPGERDQIRLTADYSKLRGTQFTNTHVLDGSVVNYGPGTTLAGNRPDLAPYVGFGTGQLPPFVEVGQPYTFSGGFYDIDTANDPLYNFRQRGVGAQWDHDFDGVRFTSITSYRRTDSETFFQSISVPANRVGASFNRKERQFTQELQLTSLPGSDIKWVAGLYYLNARAGFQPLLISGNTLAPLEYLEFGTKATVKSGAAFGQATVPLWAGANLTGGLRYTIEERALSGYTATKFLNVLPPPYPAFLAGVRTVTPAVPDKTTFRKLTWRIAFDQEIAPDITGYASYNRGFKSGAYNSRPGQPVTEPEVLDAFEVGLKMEFLDKSIRLNLAGFYYDYKNIQVTVFSQFTSLLENGAAARLYGLDLDLTAKVGPHLTLYGGLGLLDSKFKSYPAAGFFTPLPASAGGGTLKTIGSAKGSSLPYASDVTFNVGANYSVPLGKGVADFNANYSYASKFYAGPDNILTEPARGLLDASVTYTLPNDGWNIGLWARNITKEKYHTFIAVVGNPGGSETGAVGAPRTYGIRIGYEF